PLSFFTSGGTATLNMSSSGPLTGAGSLPAGTVIPISYAFSWDGPIPLFYQIFINSNNASLSFGQSGGAGSVSGGGNVTLTGAGLSGNTQFTVTINMFFSGGGTGTINIPHNSVDINPAAAAGVPEPATGGLVASALGLLSLGGWYRRRRRL